MAITAPGMVTNIHWCPGLSHYVTSPGLRGGSSDLHFPKAESITNPSSPQFPPAAPKHKPSGPKSSPVPSHSISPAPQDIEVRRRTSPPILTAASSQLFTPALSQQRLAKPSLELCTPVSCCQAKRRRQHCRGHTATDTIAQHGFRVPHVILTRRSLPLQIGTLPKAWGQAPAHKSLGAAARALAASSSPNTTPSALHSVPKGGSTPKKSRSVSTSIGTNVPACRRMKPEVLFQMQAGKQNYAILAERTKQGASGAL